MNLLTPQMNAVLGSYLNGFSDGLAARFQLPPFWNVNAGTINNGCFSPLMCGPKPAQWTASTPKDGKATIDLGDGYRLELNEHNSQMKIINCNTGEETNIWGDPHIDWNKDGQTDADFWTTTTFTLENGTKITIDTEPWKGNADMYVANKVTVTRGSNAIVVNGLSQNQIGDLSITQSENGYQLDAATRDGFVVHENDRGEGWISSQTGRLATQKDFDVTKPGAQPCPSLNGEFGAALGAFLVSSQLTGFLLAAMLYQSGSVRSI